MVDIVSVSLYVCVCIQPKLENVNKITTFGYPGQPECT